MPLVHGPPHGRGRGAAEDGATSTASAGTEPETTTGSATLPGATMGHATGDDAQPSGPCPLKGAFTDCSIDGSAGVAYCDVFDDGMRWGPCIESPACVLGDASSGCPCTLVEGVPTIVSADGCCVVEPDLPLCPQTSCAQRWEYSCEGCTSFSAGDCFAFDQRCAAPTLDCPLDEPCLPVLVLSDEKSGQLALIEDVSAPVCMLEALRDGTPGVYEVGWGASYDGGWITERVYAPGDGTVFTEWAHDCPTCPNSGTIGRTGVTPLRSPDYFDACLADQSYESLILCTVGMFDFVPDSPPPADYLPPFVVGQCTDLEPSCP